MGTRIKFVTSLDTVRVNAADPPSAPDAELIRFGAVGIWDTTTRRVAFRPRDMINYPYGDQLAVYEDDVVSLNPGKFQIEDALG